MKLLVYLGGALLAVLALAIGGLLMAGGASGRGRNVITIEISRPAAEVFRWLVDHDKRRQWISFLKSTETLSANRFRDTIEDRGAVFPLEFRITENIPGRRLVLDTASEYFDYSMEHVLVESEGKTRLTLTIDTQYKRWFARLMSPLVTRDAQQTWEAHCARLKERAEAR